MDYEAKSQGILIAALDRYDHARRGVFVEIGLGTFGYYFPAIQELGYPCFAVEPIPVDSLRNLCARKQVDLAEVCITDKDGAVEFFLGEHQNEVDLNLSSVHKDWWGSGRVSKMVSSMRLSTYLQSRNIEQIAGLKLDTEGSEPLIIQDMLHLPTKMLPKVIQFEYGGGGRRSEGHGGWSETLYGGTIESLGVLRSLGYDAAVMVEREFTSEVLFSLQGVRDFDSLFTPECVVGNIIALRGVSLAEFRVVLIRVWLASFKSKLLARSKQTVGRLRHAFLDRPLATWLSTDKGIRWRHDITESCS